MAFSTDPSMQLWGTSTSATEVEFLGKHGRLDRSGCKSLIYAVFRETSILQESRQHMLSPRMESLMKLCVYEWLGGNCHFHGKEL